MSSHQEICAYFSEAVGMDIDRFAAQVTKHLKGADVGELYLQRSRSELRSWGDGRPGGGFSADQGYGARYVSETKTGFAYDNGLDAAMITGALKSTRAIRNDAGSFRVRVSDMFRKKPSISYANRESQIYMPDSPLIVGELDQKIRFLSDIEKYLKDKDENVTEVNASIAASHADILIIREDGQIVTDSRPLVRMDVGVQVRKDGETHSASYGFGGRYEISNIFNDERAREASDEALRQALLLCEADPAPAGQMTLVLGPGWPGVMLHEAVGHGLEGDFNRKAISNYSRQVGNKVASSLVTVVDQGDIKGRRGSLAFDDEGTPTRRNVLIENGVLKGYMQDRMNARLMGVQSTGNGRRQGYSHMPMPRMTNTFIENGDHDPEEIIRSVDYGIYAPGFSGGQVDITSGRFVFSMSEAYLIEKGKVTRPLKGATMIGNGPDAMTKVSMVGNDGDLDKGIGVCGKDGQSVPVGVGQPTLRLDGITVGGTEMKP